MAEDDLEKHYGTLGLPNNASEEDVKKAFLKLSLKWHPEKNTGLKAKQKFVEITDAYSALVRSSRVLVTHRESLLSANVLAISGDAAPKQNHGLINRIFGFLNFLNWFDFKGSFQAKVSNALELLGEYMYDGDLGEFFTDADDNLNVIVNIQLARALIGGKVSYQIPGKSGKKITKVDDISGILDGYWRPIKQITVENSKIYVIFKVIFPNDMSIEEELELRRKLLFAQTSAAIFPTIWGWINNHQYASLITVLSFLLGGGAMVYKRLFAKTE